MKLENCDRIKIENLEIFANHGVFPEENRLGQKFLVSLILYTNIRAAAKQDALELSINYGEVSHFVTKYMKEHTSKLLETVAENLARELLLNYELLCGVTLGIKKPWAPVGLPLETVSVEITRSRHTAYLSIGSNMGDKKAYLDGAVEALNRIRGCKVTKVSEYLATKPYGGVEQDDFLNAALEAETLLEPEELLCEMQRIELEAKRERLVHWGPRTLDLDLLLYDDVIYDSEDLIIPHVEMELREFVLKPLAEIAPNKRHPVLKRTVCQLLKELYTKEGK